MTKTASIIRVCCEYYRVSPEQIWSRSRTAPKARVRRCKLAIAGLLCDIAELTQREIGEITHRSRDSATARIREFGILMKHENQMQKEISEIKSRLRKLGV